MNDTRKVCHNIEKHQKGEAMDKALEGRRCKEVSGCSLVDIANAKDASEDRKRRAKALLKRHLDMKTIDSPEAWDRWCEDRAALCKEHMHKRK